MHQIISFYNNFCSIGLQCIVMILHSVSLLKTWINEQCVTTMAFITVLFYRQCIAMIAIYNFTSDNLDQRVVGHITSFYKGSVL